MERGLLQKTFMGHSGPATPILFCAILFYTHYCTTLHKKFWVKSSHVHAAVCQRKEQRVGVHEAPVGFHLGSWACRSSKYMYGGVRHQVAGRGGLVVPHKAITVPQAPVMTTHTLKIRSINTTNLYRERKGSFRGLVRTGCGKRVKIGAFLLAQHDSTCNFKQLLIM